MARRLIDQDRARELRRQLRLLTIMEVRFGRAFAREVRDESEALVRGFAATGAVGPTSEEHRAKIEGLFRQMATVAIDLFGRQIVEQAKDAGAALEIKEIDFAPFMFQAAQDYIAGEAVRAKITAITETTRADIIAAIQVTRRTADSFPAIATALQKAVPGMSRRRGTLIARTEAHAASQYGAFEAAKATRVPLRKEWMTVEDSRARSAHIEADGQIREMDEPFSVWGEALMYPGDPAGSAKNVINCRCQIGHLVQ